MEYTETPDETYLGEKFVRARPDDGNAAAAPSSEGTEAAAPLQLQAVNHMSLEARDVDAMVHFYTRVLGFQRLPRPPFKFGGAWLRGGGVTLHITEADPSVHSAAAGAAPAEEVAAMQPWFNRRGRHVAFEVSDMAAAEAALRAHRVPYDKFAIPGFDGVFQIFVLDPEGHGIELGVGTEYAHVAKTLLERGRGSAGGP